MPDTSLGRAVGEVGGAIDAILAAIAPIGETFAALADSRGGALAVADLAGLDPVIRREVAAAPAVTGAGVLIDGGLICGVPRHLQWWMRTGAGLAPLRLNLDPTSIDIYDYLSMDIFTIPKAEGRPLVYGPYFDYLGIDRYIFTLTVPVTAGGRFLGVAGADVPLPDLEPGFERALRAISRDAVLVNDERRVIAANTSRWIPGHRLPRLPQAGQDGFAAAEQVGHATGWTLGVTG